MEFAYEQRALAPTQKLDAEATQPSTLDSTASDPPIPVGVLVDFTRPGVVQYVSSSDYFFVTNGWVAFNWSSLAADVQNAFMDSKQKNLTLQTSAPNLQNPSLTHYAEYDNETDAMYSWFFFQFQPGDLARAHTSDARVLFFLLLLLNLRSRIRL
jgi:hypothetical protein